MLICLATDVNVDALKTGVNQDPSLHYTENILCSIRCCEVDLLRFFFMFRHFLSQNGLMETSPGLSEIVDESSNYVLDSQISRESIAIGPNLSDEAVVRAVRDGFRLKTYR